MNGWKTYTLREIAPYCVKKVGANLLNEHNYISTDNMIVDRGGITNSVYVPSKGRVTYFDKGDILVSNIRPYFKKIWQATFEGGCSNDVFVLRTNVDIADSRFVYYYLSKQDFFDFMMAGANGVKMPRGNKEDIPEYQIKLPPLPTQRKIASILSAYDDLIENNLKRISLLEELAQITYEEWFIRMRFPGHEHTPIDEETGLPEGWVIKTNGEISRLSGGGTPSKSVDEYWDNGSHLWFSPTDLSKSNGLVQLNSATKVNDLGLKKSSAKLLQPESFMMTSRATIGLFGLVREPFSTNQGFINVTPFESFDKEYLLYNFIHRVPEFKNHSSGATFPEISKSKFEVLPITWPNPAARKLFHERIKPIHDLLFNLSFQIEHLKEARDILLPRLMTGMIDVNEIQVQPKTATV